jgi:hypothetical protein
MRIILSHGQVNIFSLAKNAGTSVEQIERFYARSPQLAVLAGSSEEPAELWGSDKRKAEVENERVATSPFALPPN